MMEPKLYVLLIAVILSALVFPILISFFKFKRSRENLLNFLKEEITEQLKQLEEFDPRLVEAITKMKSTEDFIPLVFNIDSLHGYIDWKTEKWLIPSELTSPIIIFYNDVFKVESYINIISSSIDKLPERERKIDIHKRLLTSVTINIHSGKNLETKLAAFRKKHWLLTFFN